MANRVSEQSWNGSLCHGQAVSDTVRMIIAVSPYAIFGLTVLPKLRTGSRNSSRMELFVLDDPCETPSISLSPSLAMRPSDSQTGHNGYCHHLLLVTFSFPTAQPRVQYAAVLTLVMSTPVDRSSAISTSAIVSGSISWDRGRPDSRQATENENDRMEAHDESPSDDRDVAQNAHQRTGSVKNSDESVRDDARSQSEDRPSIPIKPKDGASPTVKRTEIEDIKAELLIVPDEMTKTEFKELWRVYVIHSHKGVLHLLISSPGYLHS
nr:hypothetical protein CFP56_76689 [Quercus suber]